MAQVIDYDALRKMVIAEWDNIPNADNDPMVEACKRNANVFAEVTVAVDREKRRAGAETDPTIVMQMIMALAANVALNIVQDFRSSDESEVSTIDIQHSVVHGLLDTLSVYLHDGIGVTHNDMAQRASRHILPIKEVPDA